VPDDVIPQRRLRLLVVAGYGVSLALLVLLVGLNAPSLVANRAPGLGDAPAPIATAGSVIAVAPSPTAAQPASPATPSGTTTPSRAPAGTGATPASSVPSAASAGSPVPLSSPTVATPSAALPTVAPQPPSAPPAQPSPAPSVVPGPTQIPAPSAAPSAPAAPSPVGTPASPVPPATLFVDTFDGTTVGPFQGADWAYSSRFADAQVVATPSDADRSLQVMVGRVGDTVSACRLMEPLPDSTTLQVRLRVEGEDAAGQFLAVNSGRGVARMEWNRGFMWYANGSTLVRSNVLLRTGVWYTWLVRMDLAAGTWSIEVDHGKGHGRQYRAHLLASGPSDGPVGACFETRGAGIGATVLDEVSLSTP